ncbi:MAG: tRNA 4-thiouridine(8) synthase ThiI, partial [Vallitaleaceae bacterium]|nr:tRNA 4-thiouridine(8) synthase ThiI [Vallitaleaceae bacterium]
MKKAYLLKYGELALKGKNRYLFENALMDHVRARLKHIGEFNVIKEQGRIFVEPVAEIEVDDEVVIPALQKVFGLIGISPVVVLENDEFDTICASSKAFLESQYTDVSFTFKVEAKRANKKYPMMSMEIARELGAYLLDVFPGLSVDVKKPAVRVFVEVRTRTYMYSKVYKGLGGMPAGTNGKVMLLLSGGIDSPVAGYMIAKRGVYLDAVYFHSPPYTSERAKEKVVELARIVSEYSGKINLHVVPFTEIQLYIYENTPHVELTIIMRRIMMRIAEKLAVRQKATALVTGESIGQVASQTIAGLVTTNEVCTMPVFRPLIAFDKQDIVNLSEKIGTYETSILPYEE